MEELDVVPVQEAARILRVSRTTLWRYIKEGKISALKYSAKKILIRKKELERFIRDSEE